MQYVDGFVLAVPRRKLKDYKRLAQKAGKMWLDHGALEYRECVGDDLKVAFGIPFPKLIKLKSGEVVLFSWITYKSRVQRDRVLKKVMSDPRFAKLTDPTAMPCDIKRMACGGFKTIVAC